MKILKPILVIAVLFILLLMVKNPDLEDGKSHLQVQLADRLIAWLSGDHLGISVCRENHIFYSTFYTKANISFFGITATTKECVPRYYGVMGIFIPVSEETQNEYERMHKTSKNSLAQCPGDCTTIK
jgi:hypothetical protein